MNRTKTCVVIHPSPSMRQFLTGLLEAEGFAWRAAPDAGQGLAICLHRMPDLILVEWDMPGRDGLEFLKRLRILAIAGGDPRVLLHMDKPDDARVELARKFDGDGCIIGNIDAAVMAAKLKELGMDGPAPFPPRLRITNLRPPDQPWELGQ